ncbi:MAG TPA: DNA gyrase subunit A [Syntrophorhabdaceae bacterium]|jgi:DNA gyrase subunit A|nr:DNA gyrase subunit A [Syntrophorhabdaceae bacterium]MDI9559889.1 DNA gyrase subunit A [Pseudomonadota bacterium]OQC51457.1 MAG: DNA gyrase subunit A [Deltaproteobacteria bacterium ADurb.Bin026]MBV6504546.1 DNA gyrase subunit A [Syntrophorhabdaceae bacterium]HNZ58696.1 DNA gyrase subunit A [Syntrophorhabdaceae bacterium]
MHTSVVTVPIEEEMKKSYLDYAMSTIIGRALPDIRDGLKPVHRRILYAMYELNNTHDKPYKKSARVVGDVIGKFHPHGDQAVYDAITRMVQDFSLRYPLVDGQGNFGSIDGDAPAAMRYTEVRLSRIAEETLKDIEKDTVLFKPNYDESILEPVVLPSKIPNLLINGSSGIAVGMATNIPPHNLTEITNGIIAYIDNPDITLDELIELIPGPDFPTKGIIFGRQGIREAYETGKGHIILRARAKVEKHKKDGRESIVISEIPYQVNKTRLIENIVELINTKRIEGIANIKDESNREGMRIVLELKRGEMAIPILNKLYKHTQLQTTFGIILLTIVNNQPKTLNLKSLIAEFVNFRKEIITKRSIFELNKALERLHILEGLKIALDNIDEVIAMIKKAQNTQEAKTSLMDRFNLSEKQATSILEMRLQRLTSLERTKIVNEYNATEVEIKRLQQILADEKLLLNIIKQELTEINNKYGDERLTEIVDWLPEITTEDMIKEEEVVVTITYKGYIKRTPVDQYKHQARGGKGKIGIIVKEEDFVDHLYVASTHSYIIFFTNTGKAHIVKVFNITEAQMSSRGKPIVNLINIDKNERITAVTHVKEFSENRFLFLATKKGQVKKVTLDSLKHLRSPGIRVISLPEDDGLISVLETNGQNELMIATKKGMSIRFKETDVRPMGRVAYGIRGIKLKKDDEVVSIEVVSQDCNVFTVTEKAYGKCAPCSEYRLQTRGGSGIINVRCREKNGEVVSLKELSEKDEVILVTDTGRTIRFKTMNIPIQKRGGLGVKLMDLNEDKKIHGVAVIEEE